jgi:hypothetical protein
MTGITEIGVTKMTTDRVPMGTRTATSLHQRSTAKGVAETTVTCATSSAADMHKVRLRTGTESGSGSTMNSMMTRTMTIMVPSMTNLTDSTPQKEGTF